MDISAATALDDRAVGSDPHVGSKDPLPGYGQSAGDIWANPSLEDIMHLAERQRALEDAGIDYREQALKFNAARHGKLKIRGVHQAEAELAAAQSDGAPAQEPAQVESKEKHVAADDAVVSDVHAHEPDDLDGLSDFEAERLNARRALRVAGWMSAFYLITSDVLGPFNAPYAMSTVGYGSGTILYIVFGCMAFLGGMSVLWCHMAVDSTRHPVQTYGQIMGRLFGPWAEYLVSLLQSVQLLIFSSTLLLVNAQSLSELAAGSDGTGTICFAIAVVIWAFVGMGVGQIRTLSKFAPIANINVWANAVIIIISMVFIAKYPPNYAAFSAGFGGPDGQPDPVETDSFITGDLATQANGAANMIFAFGGATIFPEIIAELRQPRTFYKGMVLAQVFIFCLYLLYGLFCYHFQGQYTLAFAYQGISNYAGQSVCNVLGIITAVVAAVLYGNIGLKVFYVTVLESKLKAPHFLSAKGFWIWGICVILYWAIAYVVASAIPQVQTIQGLIAAVAVTQFSFSFPFLMLAALYIHKDAMLQDNEYVPGGGKSGRIDGWTSLSRWKRGLFGPHYWIVWPMLVLSPASFSMAGLLMYASGTAIKAGEVIAA